MKRITVMSALALGLLTAPGITAATAAPPAPKAPKVTLVAATAAPTGSGTFLVTANLRWKKVSGAGLYQFCYSNLTQGGSDCLRHGPEVRRYTSGEDFVGEVAAGTELQYTVTVCYTDTTRPRGRSGCTLSNKVRVSIP